MDQLLRHGLIVGLVATTVMFSNLGGSQLWDRDEPRNAGCALEMMTRGDWVTPVFNDELRTHKPVLLYWLIMSAYQVLGVSEFAARFWSAALAVGTALCTYAIGRRLFHPRAGLWSGVIMGTTLMGTVAGRAATPDSVLIFCGTLALTIYVYGVFGGKPRQADSLALAPLQQPHVYFPQRPLVILAIYAAMGLGVLAKGPVGLVLPCAVIGMFLLIARQPEHPAGEVLGWRARCLRACAVFQPLHFLRTCWSMRPLTALFVVGAIALPWYAWAGLRTDGEFLRGFFLDHNLGRATTSLEGHGGSFIYYPVAILVGFFPWSVLVVPVVVDLVGRLRDPSRTRPAALVFLICWVGVYVGLFTLARTKLPSYVTPCYPALALLTGSFIHRWTTGLVLGPELWRRLALVTYTVIGVILLAALTVAAHYYLPGDEWLGAIGAVPVVGGIAGLWLLQRNQIQRAMVVFAGSAAVFVTLLFGGAAARVSRHQQYAELLAAIEPADAVVASFGALEPSWVFYAKRPIEELHFSGEARPGRAWVETNGVWHTRSYRGVSELAASHRACYFITTERHADRLRSLLPESFTVLTEVPYFLKEDRVLLIGRGSEDRMARSAGDSTSR